MLIFFCSLPQILVLYLSFCKFWKKEIPRIVHSRSIQTVKERVLIGFKMTNNGLLESNQVSDPSERPTPILQNIVSTVNLDCTLDLKAIALHARSAEYNPKRFGAVIMRIKEPKTTALIFSSGKIVCTGAKTQQHSHLAARKYAKIVQKLGFEVKFKDFKIQNMVASCNVMVPLSLVRLGHFHYEFSKYEPELFPGLIYRMRKPKITMLIFPSGKLVITGAKTEPEIHKAFANIYAVLMSFKIGKKDK